jgi:hypothetical protein
VIWIESHGDLNRCIPCRGKPDQHATNIPHSVRVWSQTIRISCGQCMATFRELDVDGSHSSREKGLPIKSTAHRLIDPWVLTQFLSQANQWSNRLQPSFCRWQVLGLLGPYHQHVIGNFNTCSQGPTHRSLTDIGGGYSLEGTGFPHTLPNLPNWRSSLST